MSNKDYYHRTSNLHSDMDYKLLEMEDNKNMSDYTIKNYRYNHCKDKIINGPHERDLGVYNGLSVSNGYVGGCNIVTDTGLRPQIQSKPVDKLQESVPESLRFKILLPLYEKQIHNTNMATTGLCNKSYKDNACDFLTSTSLSVDPQNNFNQSFDRIGSNSRNYQRKDARFYKDGKYSFSSDIGYHGRYSK